MSLTTILFLGAAQAAFLVALIASKRSKKLPDGILAAWVLVLGLHHLLHGLHYQGVELAPMVLNLNAGVPLLQGPFLFLYVDSLTSGRRRLRPVDALHLLPFLAFAGYVSFALARAQPTHGSTVSLFGLTGWITLAILTSVPAYALVSLHRLRRHESEILDRYSERRGRDLTWLRRIVLTLLAVWGVVIYATLAPLPPHSDLRHHVMSAVTLFIYAIGYFGWRQFAVVDPEEPPAEEPGADDETPGTPPDGSPKYERSGLRGLDIEDLVARLGAHLDGDRPYLEPGITLMEIAANLGTTPNRLSQAINQGMGKNFHELVNERRVEDFKRRALAPRNRHRTLLAIAFDSGFSSKSSFNRVFKQLVGVSPRQYVENEAQAKDEGESGPS